MNLVSVLRNLTRRRRRRSTARFSVWKPSSSNCTPSPQRWLAANQSSKMWSRSGNGWFQFVIGLLKQSTNYNGNMRLRPRLTTASSTSATRAKKTVRCTHERLAELAEFYDQFQHSLQPLSPERAKAGRAFKELLSR